MPFFNFRAYVYKNKLLAFASSVQSTDFRKINSFTFFQTGINEQ